MSRRREVEAFEVTCHVCRCRVEIPCREVHGQIGICPRCGARLTILGRVE